MHANGARPKANSLYKGLSQNFQKQMDIHHESVINGSLSTLNKMRLRCEMVT